MPIFFLSDFGTTDVYAGVVEAVIAGVAPSARVVHLTHGIAPQDLRNASWQLFAAAPYLPSGSIVLAVVDPGVGSVRRAIVVECARCLWVAPDNGLLEAALTVDTPRRAFSIESPQHRSTNVSATFHGRDVFGPAAAHLSRGTKPEELGAEIQLDTLVHLGVAPTSDTRGEVWTFDRFGNAITTLRATHAHAIRIGARTLPHHTHYAAVAPGEPLALTGSSGLVEISVRDGSARDDLELVEGEAVVRV